LTDSIVLVAKVTLSAVLIAVGFTGISVGPSAATKKARWALLLAFMCFAIPDAVSDIILYFRGGEAYLLDVGSAADKLIAALFEDTAAGYGVKSAICLVTWGLLGMWVTSWRVRREMIP